MDVMQGDINLELLALLGAGHQVVKISIDRVFHDDSYYVIEPNAKFDLFYIARNIKDADEAGFLSMSEERLPKVRRRIWKLSALGKKYLALSEAERTAYWQELLRYEREESDTSFEWRKKLGELKQAHERRMREILK